MTARQKSGDKEKLRKSPGSASSSRKIAERKLAEFPGVPPGMTAKTAEELIHELQVHQIELETQAEELRQAQVSLTESRDEYLDLYDFAPIGYLTLTGAALISRANLTAAMLLGVDRTRLKNARFRTHIVPEDLERWDQYFVTLKKTDEKLTTTMRLMRADTSVFTARLESIRLKSSDGLSIRVAISDISDLIMAETELKTSGDRIRLQARMLDAVGDAVIAVNPDRRIIFWNKAATLTYGWTSEEVLGHDTIEVTVPELSKDSAREILSKLSQGESWSGEFLVRHRDGHQFPVYVTDSPVFDDNKNLIAIIGTSHDISRQHMIQDVLEQNEEDLIRAHELLEAVTKGTDVIIAVQDVNLRYIYFNETYKAEIKQLTGKDLTLGTSMEELFCDLPEELKRSKRTWQKILDGRNLNQMAEFFDSSGNRKVYHVLHTPIRDARGTIIGAGEIAYDVTKHVQTEEKLRETKEYLDNLITYASAPIIVWNPQFCITRFNRAFEHLTGRSAEEMIGQPVEILLPKEHVNAAMDLIRKTTEGERWESVEMPILHRNGEIRIVLWNSASIFGQDGTTVISTIAQGQDITDRKKIESEYRKRSVEYADMNVILQQEIWQRKASDTLLKNTLSLLHASLESTADGILVVGNEGKITSYNQNFITMWNVPPSLLENGEEQNVTNFFMPQLKNPEGVLANSKDLNAHPGRESFDMIEFLDGRIFERYSKPQKVGDTIVGRVWSFRDITDRKHAEEKLVSTLQEKEVLLREIHHRVKNNLQLISGLLDMTRMRTADEVTVAILTDMMLKIQTMAQIHTRLYESKQFGKISITSQFRDQVDSLTNIFSKKGHKITCEINPDDVFLPVDQALPCALVVNEILSNAYKHAFIGRKHGKIEVSAVQEDGHIGITIHDNGVGLPENFEFHRENSLGLKLIRTLVQHQLRGTIRFENRNGTEIRIQFPLAIEEGN
ncbi:MAG TPA: PAS domain S-box protein [Methanoregula sp.]|nr:PAS domain S-box protein [Methanoregula sp.]